MPAGRRTRTPANGAQETAFSCGRRLAGFRQPSIAETVNRGFLPWEWMTTAELEAAKRLLFSTWRRWYWAGYHSTGGQL